MEYYILLSNKVQQNVIIINYYLSIITFCSQMDDLPKNHSLKFDYILLQYYILLCNMVLFNSTIKFKNKNIFIPYKVNVCWN